MKKPAPVRIIKSAAWTMLAVWTVYGLFSGSQRTYRLFELHNYGKRVNAQIIGCEHMDRGESMGFVHYAFNDGTRAIDSRFQVPVSTYGSYPIGEPVPITYLPSDPHVVWLGPVDGAAVARSAVVAIVFIVAGLLAFGLVLVASTALLPAPTSR